MDPLSTLQNLGGGQMLEDLYEALQLTASEVVITGNQGAVTVSFKLTNQGIGDVAVQVDPSIKRSPPSRNMRGTFFFAMNGDLYRDDPRQQAMQFHEVIPTREQTAEVERQVREADAARTTKEA
jgi:hypothetical protein